MGILHPNILLIATLLFEHHYSKNTHKVLISVRLAYI